MKPGMPVLFASGGRLGDALFLCLPGNPVSVLATYLALARPLLDQLQGRAAPRPQWHARLAAPWNKVHERLEFLRGQLRSRSEEHTSELQTLMRISYAVFCLNKKKTNNNKKLHKYE